MAEEMKNEVIEKTMDDVEVNDSYPVEDSEDSESSGFGKFVIAGLAIAGAGLAALAVKNKDKIKEKRLERAKKKLIDAGYAIEGPAVVAEEDDYDEEDYVEEVETDEEQ